MRYIIKASKLSPYEFPTRPFSHTVYDGPDFNKARRTLLEYTEYGGVSFESRYD